MLPRPNRTSITTHNWICLIVTYFENGNQYIFHPLLNAILILDRVEDTFVVAGQIVKQPSQISLIVLLSRTQILPEACSIQMSKHLSEMISLEYSCIVCDLR